jgi:endonuclease/exonuclease/phosphatase (EEP) superfamily protein YafD
MALGNVTRRTHALFSWPAPFPVLAIDQVYAAPIWQTEQVRRLPRSGSDHYPILARFSRAAA